MAKRKRLSPAQSGFLDGVRAPETKSMPGPFPNAPIAQVAADAAASAALSELSAEMEALRASGRVIEAIPLDCIDESHLVRDRIEQDDEEMAALIASIEARGQQTPIEVVRLPHPEQGREYGLVSGWRRLVALRSLYARETEPRFATIRALVIAPDSAQDTYVAMVEENEIRVNLSHYERARIAYRSSREGVFPTPRVALQTLYSAVPRARRSKIGSFITLVERLDDTLRFPTAINEKLGLALVREINASDGFAETLVQSLISTPRQTAAQELAVLQAALAPPAPSKATAPVAAPKAAKPEAEPPALPDGLSVRYQVGRLVIEGDGVTPTLHKAVLAWLAKRGER